MTREEQVKAAIERNKAIQAKIEAVLQEMNNTLNNIKPIN